MLPQKPASRWRKIRLQQIILWLTLPFLGIVAAFGYVPQSMIGAGKTHRVVEEVTLPQIKPSGNTSTFWRYDQVHKGDNVVRLLRRLNVEDAAAVRYFRTSHKARSLRRLPTGKPIQAETAADGSLLALHYQDSAGNPVLFERTGNSFTMRTLPAHLETRVFMRTGVITSTLYMAADAANLPEPAANQLADIFAGEVDFHHDLRPGDRFSVIYDVAYSNGEPIQVGRVLAAELINHGVTHRAFYYRNGENSGSYYTPEGYSLNRPFLLSPVEFTRISSRYAASRYHPLLHKWRAHRGIDFAAPRGTKVMSTAEGTVSFVGAQGGYGKMVIIKHDGHYSTAYGHLSRYARYLHAGQQVAQGQIIGYVGKTGLATGPHLHYEFRVNGVSRNPQHFKATRSLDNTQRAEFQEATQDLRARLGTLHNISTARLD